MTLYLISLLAFGFVRGIHEGMINIMYGDDMHDGSCTNGVRTHIWHERSYHKIAMLRDLFALWSGWQLIAQPFSALLLIGGLLIFWELTEIGYSIARNGTVFFKLKGWIDEYNKPYEYINFADIVSVKITGWKVYALHAGRIITGITLLLIR